MRRVLGAALGIVKFPPRIRDQLPAELVSERGIGRCSSLRRCVLEKSALMEACTEIRLEIWLGENLEEC